MDTTQSDTILEAMELVAERAGDITPKVFERYFRRCRESQVLMDHMDEHMLGRMMDQVLLLLMEPGESELESYLEFETSTHRSYGVEPHMYKSLMAAVCEVMEEALASDYSTKIDAALKGRTRFLLKEIAAA